MIKIRLFGLTVVSLNRKLVCVTLPHQLSWLLRFKTSTLVPNHTTLFFRASSRKHVRALVKGLLTNKVFITLDKHTAKAPPAFLHHKVTPLPMQVKACVCACVLRCICNGFLYVICGQCARFVHVVL